MSVTLSGITTCDTVRKARAWLDREGIAYRFHDFRAEGLDAGRLAGWLDMLGWETVLNRQSASFKALPEADRAGLDEAKAGRLILDNPTLVKRPVLEHAGQVTVGFKPESYARIFDRG
ncbi:arsenate reductase [Phreatobacter sp.]|uniref:arsenate reductase n=1 Tax=Phreatobacter sp. TaxID=1966341 RepID=UPI003F6F2540